MVCAICRGEASSSRSAVVTKADGGEWLIAMVMTALLRLCVVYSGLCSSRVAYTGSRTFSIPWMSAMSLNACLHVGTLSPLELRVTILLGSCDRFGSFHIWWPW